jgi:predicted TIM-barrel fold metal-dependent hydrolase
MTGQYQIVEEGGTHMKIDAYAHIIPPKVKDFIWSIKSPASLEKLQLRIGPYPPIFNLEERFRIMDKCPDRVEVLTLAWFAVDNMADSPKGAIELAQRINDALAELVLKYPDRFVAAAAVLPYRNMDAALTELERAIKQLNLKGILIRHPIDGKPIDLPEFMPLYEKMSNYDLPIYLHPVREIEFADYPQAETESKYHIFRTFGLPYETAANMSRLIFSGVLEKYPNLKFITHHCGGIVPYLAQRIVNHYNMTEQRLKLGFTKNLSKPVIEYFRMFYNDTAIVGNTPALMCAYDFFGADHMLFAHDMPMDADRGEYAMLTTIKAIEQMNIPDADRKKIFGGNAKKLLRLSL